MSFQFEIDVEIARRTSEVFDFVADPEHLAEWQPMLVDVKAKPPAPLKQGSVLREVRQMRGREIVQLVEVAEFERPGASPCASSRARSRWTGTSPSSPRSPVAPVSAWPRPDVPAARFAFSLRSCGSS